MPTNFRNLHHPSFVEQADILFKRVDRTTDLAIKALGKNGFHALDLEVVMLGIPNRAFPPNGMKKRINYVEPIRSEIELETKSAEKNGTKVETATEKGILLNNGHRLKIIDNGLMLFMQDGGKWTFKTDFKAIGESALNELALYQALAFIAEDTLAARSEKPDNKYTERLRVTTYALRKAVDELVDFVNLSVPKNQIERWEEELTLRTGIYANLFEHKRIKEKPDSQLESASGRVSVAVQTPAVLAKG